jgi:hypothetical protein
MLAGSYRDAGETPAALRSLGRAALNDPAILTEVIRHAAGRPRVATHRSATD